MSLTWHIARKDIYRLRWIVLLWVVVLVSEMALASIEAGLDADVHTPFYMAAWTFGYVFAPVIAFGLVMAVQDDDPVTQADAFWMTRPIAGARLLCAKALVLVLFCLLPVVVTLPFWLAHDFGIRAIGRAAVEILWSQLLITAAAVPFAALSASGSKFILNIGIGTLALVLLGIALHLSEPSEPSHAPDSVLVSRAWIILCIWVVASAATVLNQYLGRRTRRSVLILAAAAAFGFAAARWPGAEGPPASAALPDDRPKSAPAKAEVTARAGDAVTRGGRSIKVISVTPDFTRGLVVEISESEPDRSAGFPQALADSEPSRRATERYLLVSQDDGRAMTAEAIRGPEELRAARLRYFRTTLVFKPDRDLAGNLPTNVVKWAQNALLIKVTGRDTGLSRAGNSPDGDGVRP
jgi:hypothetical protein